MERFPNRGKVNMYVSFCTIEKLNELKIVTNPHTSLRQLEHNFEVPKSTAQRFLKKFKYWPYKTYFGQELRNGDLERTVLQL